MRKVSHYVLDHLSSLGIKEVFVLTGGACAHLIDSFHGRDDIRYVCTQHEQAAAMAAECYARVGPGIGAAMATSGPGATNLITGICCAWFDSIPAIYITGQVNTFESRGDSAVRQVGFQETDIVSMVRPVTKLAKSVDRPEDIRRCLEEATYVARTGRPGPVLVDIPMNIQRAMIDPARLTGFVPTGVDVPRPSATALAECVRLIERAERPVLLVGGGVRCAGAGAALNDFIRAAGMPVVCSWSGLDLVPVGEPLYVGQIGVYGARGANFAVQNADLVLSVGSRLDTRQTGGKPETFARAAKKIMVDIDPAELSKRRGLTPDVEIAADAGAFLADALPHVRTARKRDWSAWLAKTHAWRDRYPSFTTADAEQKEFVNPYVFGDRLSAMCADDAIVVPECGANLVWMMQAFGVRGHQRVISAFGNSPMGYALPASIGAAFAQPNKQIVCILGDGGMQINLQELQTVVHHRLPIKIFILNNHGYGIIKQFQEMYFDSRYEATGHGYSCPDFRRIADAYGIASSTIANHDELDRGIRHALDADGPIVCDVLIKSDQKLIPKLEFGRPIEDLTPLLDRDEFLKNMIVDPHESSIKREGELV